jgi:diguanylate cyclase (GGDEF)-like protein
MDFRTLFAVNLFGMVLCAVALMVNAVNVRNARISAPLILCSLSGGTGMLLMMLYGRINDFYVGVGSYIFIQLAFVFMYQGYAGMTQKPHYGWRFLLGLTVIGACAMTYYVMYSPEIAPRVIIMGLGIIVGSVACIALLVRVPEVFYREASWLSILCLSVYAVANMLRIISVLLHPPVQAYLSTAVVQPGFLLVNMMALAGLTYGHIWITGARQRLALQSQAYTDELTGVLNRRALELEVEREISRSRRGQQPLAVMMCDLDNFKTANDTLGHLYGDEVLRAVSGALRNLLRREDLIARPGGDEFVVLLPATNREKALEVAERLRGEIERLHVVEHGRHMGLRASFGMAMLDSVADDTWHTLLARVDAALYAAKHAGGNYIVMDVNPDPLPNTNLPAEMQGQPEDDNSAHPGPTTIH